MKTECTENRLNRYDCMMDDCHCKKCDHGLHPGLCMDCAYPQTEIKRVKAERDQYKTERDRCVRALTTINSIARHMLDEDRRKGPGMSGLQQSETSGRCVPDATEKEEAR